MPTRITRQLSQAHIKPPTRVLIACHGHPQLSRGGAEIAAHELFTALMQHPGYESWFLGCVGAQANHKLATTISQPFSAREYVYGLKEFDWFNFANRDSRFPGEFRSLLKELNPQVVHFHHYANLGVEAFLHVRETLPDCKIVLTLHEYLALCHNSGQMVTRQDRALCRESTPLRCAQCFTDLTPADFFLRKLYIRRFFELVDLFIAPSQFLADRYVAWGIDATRISTVDNLASTVAVAASASSVRACGDLKILRVGYFGQISAFKGIHVLFDAAKALQDRGVDDIVFEIHGDCSTQASEVQAEFRAGLEKLGACVRFFGPYDSARVDELMQGVDLVLVPSIWWENSPVVIQEARRNRRPVVCSNIGGMAEKVRDGVDGFHFPVGNPVALAALLAQLAAAPERLMAIREAISPPDSSIVEQHAQLYASLAA